jgi:hypothetical protein
MIEDSGSRIEDSEADCGNSIFDPQLSILDSLPGCGCFVISGKTATRDPFRISALTVRLIN